MYNVDQPRAGDGREVQHSPSWKIEKSQKKSTNDHDESAKSTNHSKKSAHEVLRSILLMSIIKHFACIGPVTVATVS